MDGEIADAGPRCSNCGAHRGFAHRHDRAVHHHRVPGSVRSEFGAIVGLDYSPGLHWKWPWDQVVKFDRRILSQSYTGETFLTNDNRGLIVDFYVKWKVKDASRYFQATGGREDLAGDRIAEIVKDGIKSVVAQRTPGTDRIWPSVRP